MSNVYPSMQGKTCLVTGATSGIGKATVLGLARQLEGSGVTLNGLNPGFVFTNMGMSNVGPRTQALARAILARLGSSPEKGAQTSLYLAMSPGVESLNGKYIDQLVVKRSSALSYDQALQDQVWEESLLLVHLSGVQE